MERLPTYENCFFCGRDPNGLHLKIEYSDHVCSCSFTIEHGYQGFQGVLHGGIVSGILDEIMWWAIFMETGAICATWKMDLEFRRTVLFGKGYRALGRYRDARHGNYHVSGSIEDDSGNVCATAAAVFRKLRDTDSEEFFKNLDFSESSKEIESILRTRLLGTNGENLL